MKIPGVGLVGSLADGVTGGAAQVVRAGAQAAAGAAGTVQMLASPVVELAGPVVQSVAQSTGRVLGSSSTTARANHVEPPVRWQSGRRVHLDLDPLLPFPRWDEHAAVVEEPVRRIPGVAEAHVEGSLGRLVVELEDDADTDAVLDEVRDVVGAVAADLTLAGCERAAPKTAPFADPGNPLAILVPLTAAAMDVVAMTAAVTGWVARLPAAPQTTRAAAALINHQPRMVSLLESRLGRVGTDIALSRRDGGGQRADPGGRHAGARSGATQPASSPRRRRTGACGETGSRSWPRPSGRRRRWSRSSRRPGPNRRRRGTTGRPRRRVRLRTSWSAEPSTPHIDTAKGSMKGPVESYVDSAANGSLIAAASALLAGGGTEDAAGAILAGVPRAAHMGRQAFAAVLGRGLANAGQLVLDPGALRRLDRVQVVVIDGAALRGDHRAVLHARGDAPGWDDDRVYEVADALLHGEEAPEPDPDELPATGARLRWVPAQGPSATPAQGLEHADLVVDGERVGSVDVGWEVDPYAIPLLQTAHRTGARVVLRHVAGTEDLSASVGATHPPGTPLLTLVRDLRTDRGPVLLITALHRDFASTDTLAALAIADVGVALDDPRAATPWTADIITGTDLAAAVRILSALPVARSASESSVRLAQGGTHAGRAAAGHRRARRRTSTQSPSGAGSIRSTPPPRPPWLAGAYSASRVLRLADPTPQPLTAWHALDPEIVYSRLAGGTRPLAVEPGTATWRRFSTTCPTTLAWRRCAARPQRVGGWRSPRGHELADPLTPILAVGAAASAIVGSNIDALLVAGVMTVNAITGGAATVTGRGGGRRAVRRAGPVRAPSRSSRRWRRARRRLEAARTPPNARSRCRAKSLRAWRRHRPGRAGGGTGGCTPPGGRGPRSRRVFPHR